MVSAGTHVTIDAYVKDSVVFMEGTLKVLFTELVNALGMTILFGPHFIEVPIDPEVLKKAQETGIFHDEGGITGFCIINTSHVSIHTWPLQKFFSMDVFSCSDFNPEIAVKIIKKHLGVDKNRININVLQREKPLTIWGHLKENSLIYS
jgi:S-adenosylmethionine decarboxylase